jgi:hypothetical protein
MATGSRRAVLGLDGRGRPSPHERVGPLFELNSDG